MSERTKAAAVEAAAPEPAAEPAPPKKKTFLVAITTEGVGRHGSFVDLTADEEAAAPEGVLLVPTAEQLAQRR